MKTVQFENYELNDLVRILEYAEKKKKEDMVNGIITTSLYNLDKQTIQILLSRIPKKNDNRTLIKDILD